MLYHVVVVGGGPAGASAAYHLSKKGFRVIILEKEKLPRFKLCAGCISVRTQKLLPEGYERLLLNTITAGRLAFKDFAETRLEADGVVAWIVDRGPFDHFLLIKALETGAELMHSEFLGLDKQGGKYKVYTSHGAIITDHVVGADGFYSKVAKVLGYKKRKFFRSLEIFTEGDMREEVLIEIGHVSRGYLWTFPHGEGVSLGIASTGKEDLFKILMEYAQKRGMKFHRPKGWHIPFIEREHDLHVGEDRVLLVGDAANMTDPLLGEGIYYALWGGRLLADAIVKNPSSPVRSYRIILKPLLQELIYAGRIARLAYSFQSIAYRMGKDFALRSFYQLLTGEKTYKSLYWSGLPSFLKHLTFRWLRGIIGFHEGSSRGHTSDHRIVSGKH